MAWCQPESHYLIFVYLGIESHLNGAANFQIVNQGLSLLRRWTMNEFTTINEKTIEEVVDNDTAAVIRIVNYIKPREDQIKFQKLSGKKKPWVGKETINFYANLS